MGFLQRAVSSRTTKDEKGTSLKNDATMDNLNRYTNKDVDRAIGAHSKAVGQRPSTTHGVGRRQRSPNDGSTGTRTVKEQTPTCLEDLQKSGHIVEYKDGLDTFRFPTPSPRMPSMPRSATATAFRHSPSQLHHESPAIGIALEFPTNAPPSLGRSFTADDVSSRMSHKLPNGTLPPPLAPQSVEPAAVAQGSPDVRKKKSGWKTIRTVFRWTSKPAVRIPQLSEMSQPYSEMREAAPPEPVIKELAPSEAPSLDLPRPGFNKQRHTRMHSGSSLGTLAQPKSGRSLRGSSPALRSSFMPNLRGKLRATRGSVTPEFGKSFGWGSPRPLQTTNTRHDSPISHDAAPPSPAPRTPRLDVNFERPEFERYSVMFEKLLSNDPKPSLLERRQSRVQQRKSEKRIGDVKTGERLQVVTQGPGTPKRSMTSPHLSKGLPLRVDCGDDHGVDNMGPSMVADRPRYHQRANTAPLNTTFPLATNLTRSRKVTLESSPESNESDLFSESSLPSTPATVVTCTDTESLWQEVQESEPAFDMVTPDHSQKIMADCTHTSNQYPRVKSQEDLERQMVQVSVARQVSVSQARSIVRRAVSSNIFKQPVRPKVVELHKNRKSEVGLLESTCEEDQTPLPSRGPSRSEEHISYEALTHPEQEHGSPRQAPMKAPIGPFPDPLKLNPPTPMVATFAESANK
ncbi:hypothetical protein DOTSEDRAFT_74036 [Dothistroma septosporum NZE10]|uniref:Uncharacterized protein n=1 Tax=Dothistroma septosporum (strain NZE10 / CBS 128990) TaxID=675120 RepID=N1PHJ0_DOTSN|nr:hypothetical protein DOTSEDRAFT_74036 [Dothistroma septosporum NZE10]